MLKQPVTQVRLTNVAVVRMRRCGRRFEVACYKNKVLGWRSGVETDLSEVLQSEAIFTNVSKGQLAKAGDLMHAFGTRDACAVARMILDKGELQVSERERDAALQNAFRDLCSVVAPRIFNRQTNLPLPPSAVENLLRNELRFSVSLDAAVKPQAVRATAELCSRFPDLLGRTQMGLRLAVAAGGAGAKGQPDLPAVRAFLEREAKALIVGGGGWAAASASPPGEPAAAGAGLPAAGAAAAPRDSAAGAAPADAAAAGAAPADAAPADAAPAGAAAAGFVIDFFCNPAHYRRVRAFCEEHFGDAATLEITASNHMVYNPLDVPDGGEGRGPPAAGEGEGPRSDGAAGAAPAATAAEGTDGSAPGAVSTAAGAEATGAEATGAEAPGAKAPGAACRVCSAALPPNGARAHFKSEWHQLNVKRRFKKMEPVSLEDFRALGEDLVHGFLAVDAG